MSKRHNIFVIPVVTLVRARLLCAGAVEFRWQVLRLSIHILLPTQSVLSCHLNTAFISTLHILFMFAFHVSPPSICEGQMKLKAEVSRSKEWDGESIPVVQGSCLDLLDVKWHTFHKGRRTTRCALQG